jgi:hypothetical protein
VLILDGLLQSLALIGKNDRFDLGLDLGDGDQAPLSARTRHASRLPAWLRL